MYTITTQISYKELMKLSETHKKEIHFIDELKKKVDWFYFLHSNINREPYAPTRCLSSDISLYNTLYETPFYVILITDKYYYKKPIFDAPYISYDWSPRLSLLDAFFNTRTLNECALKNKETPKDIRIPALDRLLSIEKKEELIDKIKKIKIKDQNVVEIKISKDNFEISYPLA